MYSWRLSDTGYTASIPWILASQCFLLRLKMNCAFSFSLYGMSVMLLSLLYDLIPWQEFVAICGIIWRENDVVRRGTEVLVQILEEKHSMSPELAVLMVLNLKQIYLLVIKMSQIYKDIFKLRGKSNVVEWDPTTVPVLGLGTEFRSENISRNSSERFLGRKCSFRGIPSSAEEPIPKLGMEQNGTGSRKKWSFMELARPLWSLWQPLHSMKFNIVSCRDRAGYLTREKSAW